MYNFSLPKILSSYRNGSSGHGSSTFTFPPPYSDYLKKKKKKQLYYSRWDLKLIHNLSISSHASVKVGGFLFKYVDWYMYHTLQLVWELLYTQREKQLQSASLYFWTEMKSLQKTGSYLASQHEDFQDSLVTHMFKGVIFSRETSNSTLDFHSHNKVVKRPSKRNCSLCI